MATNRHHLNSRGARRRTLLVLTALAAALVAPSAASAYGWPVKPFDRQHPVRGFFGDPRIGGHDSRQFHFGVDVSAPNGTPVYATLSGVVYPIGRHSDAISIRGAGGVEFEYWHIVPTVRPFTRVVAYRTVIGRIEKPWAHVHFSELRDGVYVNPLRRGALAPFVDVTTPRVVGVRRDRGYVVADVADATPLLVPAPWSALPVMPALVRWRIDGTRRWHVAADFRRTIPAASTFRSVYAPLTRQNHANRPGLYRVRLSGAPTGRRIEVEVQDVTGNSARLTMRPR